jgi:acetoin utilization deacetylase AcuC-like enzyme
MIIDWDVHHGNGTQDIFYGDPSVYYISLHLSPHYPGTGHVDERGAGAGANRTRNVPLPHGTTAPRYRTAFTSVLDAALAEFDPQFILVSAGYDCMAGDPLGGLPLTSRDLYDMTTEVRAIADDRCDGRLVLMLEGGYAPRAVANGVVNSIHALIGLPPAD